VKTACLRCGNFVEEDEASVRGIALCASCLEGTPPTKDNIFTCPPPSITWKRIRPFTALGFLIPAGATFTYLVDHVAKQPAWNLLLPLVLSWLLMGVFGAVVGELVGLALLYVAIPFHPMKAWRRLLLAKLDLPVESPDFSLALLARRDVKVTQLRMPLEVGLLAVGEGGLAFLGERGTRFGLRRTEVAKTGTIVLLFCPPRFAARLELADGRRIFFVPLESSSPWESRRLVRELAAKAAGAPKAG
jgi:hypothetical protein